MNSLMIIPTWHSGHEGVKTKLFKGNKQYRIITRKLAISFYDSHNNCAAVLNLLSSGTLSSTGFEEPN